MTTFVGTQEDFITAVKELIELDFDAIESYEAAIKRIENEEYKKSLEEFRNDHQRHIDELSEVLRIYGHEIPKGPSSKQWLTKGKIVIAELLGDKAILSAMVSNEEDTNTAYERMDQREDQPLEFRQIIANGLKDEQKHREWLERVIQEIAEDER